MEPCLTRRATPCIPWSPEGTHCLMALLHGAACCPHGDCALCEAAQHYQRRTGEPELAVAQAWVRMRLARRDRCPVCGFPPPPAPERIEPLPRLDRSDRVLVGRTRCRYCDRRIVGTRRKYCGDECWRGWVAWSRRQERDALAAV